MAVRILFSFVILFFVVQGEFASAGTDAAEKLSLIEAEIAGTRVYYEKCFEGNLSELEKAYKRFIKEKGRLGKLQNEIISKKEAIVSEINRIFDINEPSVDEQYEILTNLVTAFEPPKLVLFVVRQETTKDFLRSGGQLPSFSYDKATDRVTYRAQFVKTSSSKPSICSRRGSVTVWPMHWRWSCWKSIWVRKWLKTTLIW